MTDRPRLVFATGIFPPEIGGPSTYVSKLSRALRSEGWPIRIVTYGEDPSPGDDTSANDIPEEHIRRISRSQSTLRRYRAFARAVGQACEASPGRPIVFAQDPLSSGLPASWASRSRNAVFVLKVVGDLAWEIARAEGWTRDSIETFQRRSYPPGRIWLARRLERRVARLAEHVITPSRYLKELVFQWGVTKDRMSVVPNGAEPEATSLHLEDDRAFSHRLPEPPWILTAGRLVPWKGFDLVIQSLARLSDDYPKLRLLIAGAGQEEGRLRELTERLRLNDRVVFLGSLGHDRLAHAMRRATVLVLASSYEGMSHLLIEAMQLGVPIVASRNGGNPELIRDGVDGHLFDRDSNAMLDSKLRAMLDDEASSKRMGEQARQRASQFAWSKTVAATSSLLERIAARA